MIAALPKIDHPMRHAFVLPAILALLSAAPAPAQAQAQHQDQLKANLENKLAKEFVESGAWRLDYDEARAEAAREKKLLFVYFTRTFAP